MNGGSPTGSDVSPETREADAQRAALIEAQRLALAGTRAAMLAHEFNNLMTPILARAIDAAQRDDPAMSRKALDRIATQAQKAIDLSRHLLRLADPSDDVAVTTELALAVEEALAETIRPFAKDGIDLQVDVPGDLVVRGQPVLVEQVLLNLLINARDAMKDMRGSLHVKAEREGASAAIQIRDTGRGIDPDDIEARFAPFLAANGTAEPLDWRKVGLGLYVCRLIAHEHGATLEVAPNDGPGCTFTLHWPLA